MGVGSAVAALCVETCMYCGEKLFACNEEHLLFMMVFIHHEQLLELEMQQTSSGNIYALGECSMYMYLYDSFNTHYTLTCHAW